MAQSLAPHVSEAERSKLAGITDTLDAVAVDEMFADLEAVLEDEAP